MLTLTRTQSTLPQRHSSKNKDHAEKGFLNRTCADLRHGRHAAGSRRKDAPETESLTRIPTVCHSTRVRVRARISELGWLTRFEILFVGLNCLASSGYMGRVGTEWKNDEVTRKSCNLGCLVSKNCNHIVFSHGFQ